MAQLVQDAVVENANNPGTGDIHLAGAAPGSYVTFATRFSSGDKVFYGISDESTQREIGIGTFTAGTPNIISRDTVLSNTSGNTSKLNFAGLVFVYNICPASHTVFVDESDVVNLGSADVTTTGTVSAADVSATGTVSAVDINATGTISSEMISTVQILVSPNGADIVGDSTLNGLITQNILLGSSFTIFQLAGTTVGSITGSGSTTSYNTTSDQRLKDEAGSLENSGAIIDALLPKMFVWKDAFDAEPQPGFFAQEVNEIYPWAVTVGEGEPDSDGFRPWQIDVAKLMPVVIAEIKSLRERLRKLEVKLASQN